MRKIAAFIMAIFISGALFAQENLPTDYLSAGFHRGRREAFRAMMPEHSVALIFAYPERVFSNDVNYVFHQNPDMYYFSGYNEPNSVLVMFKDMHGGGDTAYNEVLFVRERNPAQETWTGRRLGVDGAKQQLGFARVYTGNNFAAFNIDFKNFKTILYDRIPGDMGDDGSGFGLAALYKTFETKAGIKPRNEKLIQIKNVIMRNATMQNLPRIIERFKIKELAQTDDDAKNDAIIQQILAQPDEAKLAEIKRALSETRDPIEVYNDIMNALRGIKTPEEIVMMRKAATISALGHAEVMKAVTPNMSEREVEGIHRYVHAKYGAEEEGYPPIVGAGANGCILHYEENTDTKIDNQLFLMDVACEYHGYSADVTRTVPANGKFTEEQKAIYQLVFDAQDAAMKLCTDGHTFGETEEKAASILAAGLVKLGIITNEKDVRKYYPHGLSHHVGLDVHDNGRYDTLRENMVITVEPGLYIPAGSNCDKKWWNIGVRIEDDVVIGKQSCEILSIAAPRTWQDVEKKAAEKSVFENVQVPALK